jgi:hypothetical protein
MAKIMDMKVLDPSTTAGCIEACGWRIDNQAAAGSW